MMARRLAARLAGLLLVRESASLHTHSASGLGAELLRRQPGAAEDDGAPRIDDELLKKWEDDDEHIDDDLEDTGMPDWDHEPAEWGPPEGCDVKTDKQMQSNCKIVRRGVSCQPMPTMHMEDCHVSETNNCSIDQLRKNATTLVHPGGDTVCLKGDKYRFQVIPRDPTKLLISFQGGGVCNSKKTVFWGFCCDHATPHNHEGILAGEKEWSGNLWRDHTVINVLFCSGDTHLGNSTKPYLVWGKRVHQKGLLNALSALHWGAANFPRPRSLVIHGSSAGSYAVQAFTAMILSDELFSATGQRMVIMDSGIGNYRTKTMARALSVRSGCDNFNHFSPHISRQCYDGKLTYHMLLRDTIRRYPHIPFVALDSKEDTILRAYYSVVEKGPTISGPAYYKRTLAKLDKFKGLPNFGAFIVDGAQHMFLMAKDTYMWSSAASKHPAGTVALSPWLQDVYDRKCSSGDWVCHGEAVFDKAVADKKGPTNFCPASFGHLSMHVAGCQG